MIWAIKESKRIKASPKEIAFCPICREELIAKCGRIKIWHWSHKSLKDCDNWAEPESEWHINWKNEFPKEQQEVIINSGGDKFRADNFDILEKSHRADIKTKSGTIIELQNSSISSEEIIERERFYWEMIWLINGEKLCKGLDLRKKNGIITFRWKNPPKSWWDSKKPIYIDLSKITIKLKNNLKKYYHGEKHYSSYKTSEGYEFEDDYGNFHESNYPRYKTECFEDTINYIKEIVEKINFMENNLFLIKKIYKNLPCGGWGILLTKEKFLKEYGAS